MASSPAIARKPRLRRTYTEQLTKSTISPVLSMTWRQGCLDANGLSIRTHIGFFLHRRCGKSARRALRLVAGPTVSEPRPKARAADASRFNVPALRPMSCGRICFSMFVTCQRCSHRGQIGALPIGVWLRCTECGFRRRFGVLPYRRGHGRSFNTLNKRGCVRFERGPQKRGIASDLPPGRVRFERPPDGKHVSHLPPPDDDVSDLFREVG
jgi:hypothetical protein